MRHLFILLSSFLALSLTAQPLSRPADTLRADTSVRIGRLDNGLRYYIRYNNEPRQRAELRLAIRAGSLQEEADQLGVAHFVEHMAFNGTRHFERNELINFLERSGSRFGADLNAYTSFAETVYQLEIRTDSLPLLTTAVQILDDWASGLLFDPTEIDKERGVVIAEWRSRLSPDQRLQQQFLPVLYEGSRFAERLPIGSPDLIDTVSPARIRAFYERWYCPDLMAVVAVGDFDVDWMEAQIRAHFSDLENPPAAPNRRDYVLDTQARQRLVVATDDEAPFTQWRIIYQLDKDQPSRTLADYREQLIQQLHNTLLNGRLFELTERTRPPFTFAYTGFQGLFGPTRAYEFYTFALPDSLLAAMGIVLRETARVRQHGFLSTELQRAKDNYLRAVEQQLREDDKRGSAGRADGLVQDFLTETPPISLASYYEQLPALLNSITTADLDSLACSWSRWQALSKCLPSGNLDSLASDGSANDIRTFIITTATANRDRLPDSTRLFTFVDSLLRAPTEPYVDRSPDGELLQLDKEPGTARLVMTDSTLGVSEYLLSNGVRLVLKPTDFKNDEILMSAFSPGGTSLADLSKLASADHATALASLSGLDTFRVSDLSKLLTGKEADVGAGIQELFEGVGGQASPEDLETLFQLTYLHFTTPRFDSTALDTYRERQRGVLENMFNSPFYAFAEFSNRVKYRDHPRRRMTTMAELEAIDLAEAERFYRERFADASDFTFVFVGNFAVDTLLDYARRYLATLPATQRGEQWRDPAITIHPAPLDTVMTLGQTQKAVVNLEWNGDFPYADSDERYVFNSLERLVEMRLREVMREDQGRVYGVRVSSFLTPEPQAVYRFNVSYNAEPAQALALVDTVQAVLQAISEGQISLDNLRKIQAGQRKQLEEGRRTNNYWLGQLLIRYRNQLGLEGLRPGVTEATIDSLTIKDLARAAARYLRRDRRLGFVLLPQDAVDGRR